MDYTQDSKMRKSSILNEAKNVDQKKKVFVSHLIFQRHYDVFLILNNHSIICLCVYM